MNRDTLLNLIFPVVIQTIKDLESEVHFIIKGGASIKYHLLYDHGINTKDLTYDIDIAPILEIDPYSNFEQRSLEFNQQFYRLFEYNLKNRFGSEFTISFTLINGLITINILDYDIIDLSYIDPTDQSSTFIKAINHLYQSYDNFLLLSQSFDFVTPIELELYVAIYGAELYQETIDQIPYWRQKLEQLLESKDEIELDLLSEEDESVLEMLYTRLSEIKFYIAQYEHQLSVQYIDRLEDKIKRFNNKILLIKKYYFY